MVVMVFLGCRRVRAAGQLGRRMVPVRGEGGSQHQPAGGVSQGHLRQVQAEYSVHIQEQVSIALYVCCLKDLLGIVY